MAAPDVGIAGSSSGSSGSAAAAAELDEFNYWRVYRGQDNLDTVAQMDALFGTPYVAPVPAPRIPAAVPFRGVPQRAMPQIGRPWTQGVTTFMAGSFAELAAQPGIAANWRGTKFLGDGGDGSRIVGLWEYRGQANPKPKHTQIAVKQLTSASNLLTDNLAFELEHLNAVYKRQSQHVVRVLYPSTPIVPADLVLPAAWNGVTVRLFLEYCPLGSLDDLLQKRITEQTRFSEVTLWLLFNCLIDGISTMEFDGDELYVDQDDNVDHNLDEDDLENSQPIVHFDIKPANFLLGRQNVTHSATPVVKLGDFGHAIEMQRPPEVEDPVFLRGLRRQGTEDYYAPEQFSEQWDHSDWLERYDYRMNIWQIGVVMWMLAMLSEAPPKIPEVFLPFFTICGSPPAGNTYGADLEATTYSATLKGLIFECLYEHPDDRPDLEYLKLTVHQGIKAAFAANSVVDPWQDFLPPEPPNAVVVPPAPPLPPALPAPAPVVAPLAGIVPMVRVPCGYPIATGKSLGRPCRNKVQCTMAQFAAGNIPRCWKHADRNRFP